MLPGKQLEVGLPLSRINTAPRISTIQDTVGVTYDLANKRSRIVALTRQRVSDLTTHSRQGFDSGIARIQRVRSSLPHVGQVRSLIHVPSQIDVSSFTQTLQARLGTIKTDTQERISQIVEAHRSQPRLTVNHKSSLERVRSSQFVKRIVLPRNMRLASWIAGPQAKPEPNFATTPVIPADKVIRVQEMLNDPVYDGVAAPSPSPRSLRQCVRLVMNRRITPDILPVLHDVSGYLQTTQPVLESWHRPFRQSSPYQQVKSVVNVTLEVRAFTKAHIRERGIITVLDELKQHQLQLQDAVRESERLSTKGWMSLSRDRGVMQDGAQAKLELRQMVLLPRVVIDALDLYASETTRIQRQYQRIMRFFEVHQGKLSTSVAGNEAAFARSQDFLTMKTDFDRLTQNCFGDPHLELRQNYQQRLVRGLIADAPYIALPGGVFPTQDLLNHLEELQKQQQSQDISVPRNNVAIETALKLAHILQNDPQYNTPDLSLDQRKVFGILGMIVPTNGELVEPRLKKHSLARKYLSAQMQTDWARGQFLSLQPSMENAEKARRLAGVFITGTLKAANAQNEIHNAIVAHLDAQKTLAQADTFGEVVWGRVRVASGPLKHRIKGAILGVVTAA